MARRLTIPEQHQLKVARATLRMSPAMARVMGGPTHAEAREIIAALTGRAPRENPRKRKVSKRAARFIGRKIRTLAHEGMRAPRRVAAAYSLARRAGFKVPKRTRSNPYSESSIWEAVLQNALEIQQDSDKNSWSDIRSSRIVAWAKTMLRQLKQGVHENPTLAVLGNPGKARVVGTLSRRLYELRYKHASDGKDYRHPFGPGASVVLLSDGNVLIRAKHRLWEDI